MAATALQQANAEPVWQASSSSSSGGVVDAYGRRNPSLSQSFGSRLPQMGPRAARALAAALGRPPPPGPPMGAEGAEAAPAPATVPSGPLYRLGAASFQQIPHAALSIDAGLGDLLYAFRAAVAQGESPGARAKLHAGIAALFRTRPNVYDSADAVAAAAERAQRPPLSAEAAADPRAARVAAAFASPAAPSLPSPVNVNAVLPARMVAPAYLLDEHNFHTGLSARSCLDCWLSVVGFERGSVVLLTAVNIPDISVVLRAHGLIPVPVDVEVGTLAPRMDLLEKAAADGTAPGRREGRVVAILVAQLYGRRFDMEPVAALAARHSLRLVEDLAESFAGLDHAGHPAADLALLSFGSIKVATAFGAGVARVRDRRVWEKMQRMQEGWAVQSRQTFFSKVGSTRQADTHASLVALVACPAPAGNAGTHVAVTTKKETHTKQHTPRAQSMTLSYYLPSRCSVRVCVWPNSA